MNNLFLSQHERCLKTSEAAEYLGLCAKTLRCYRYDGIGPAYVRFGKTVRYRLSDLNEWRYSNLCKPAKKEK